MSFTIRHRRLGVGIAMALFVGLAWTPRAADADESQPSYYVKQDSWAATMVASREALRRYEQSANAFKPFESSVMRQGMEPEKISVSVAGLEEIWLTATDGGDGPYLDHAVWGEARLIAKDGSATYLSDLKPLSQAVGWSEVLYGKAPGGAPLSLGGKEQEHGVYAHAESRLCYRLAGRYERFEASVGINDSVEKGGGSVTFKILNRMDPVPNILQMLARDFPREAADMAEDAPKRQPQAWFRQDDATEIEAQMLATALEGIAPGDATLRKELEALGEGADTATRLNFYARAARVRDNVRKVRTIADAFNPSALREAIQDTLDTFGAACPNGKAYLDRLPVFEKRLAAMEKAAAEGDEAALEGAETLTAELQAFKRQVLVANPLVSGQPLLYVHRAQYKPDHHNTETMFLTNEINTNSFVGGGALKAIDLASGETRTLLETRDGLIRDPEMHFSGERIIFSMRKNIEDDYHIYEINSDGSGLRQLTSAPGVADIDPLYMPDDSIAFSSTREPKYCMCNRHIMANLFRMDADGANIHQIGKSTLMEGHGSLTPDGRILYYRWEYVDRNFGDAQGLWTVNPDGTNHAVYWGNNTPSPGGVIDAHIIPGTQRFISVFGSCHDRPWGAIGIVDRRLGLDGRKPIVRTWPASAIDLARDAEPNMPYVFDNYTSVYPKYEDPRPLSDKYFLCSRMTGQGEEMGIYLIDLFGNEVQLHAEAPGCFDPMPLGPRPRPDIVPSRRDFEGKPGRFLVMDVYEGASMSEVERGAVRYLRVVESPEKRFWSNALWSGQGAHCPGMNWDNFENKRILGTVPVEADGSAYFEVPSDKYVFFQLLDENKMLIQSMRSGTIVQSDEKTGCIGCHDERRTAPRSIGHKAPLAAQREPSKLGGWYGEPRLFSFQAEVQPVFDKHCVECHDYGKKAGEKLNLAGDRDNTFCASYVDLWMKGAIKSVGAGPAAILPAYTWGSHKSKIVQAILKGHKDVKLSQEEIDRVVTWIDINAPYYPTYATSYPDNLGGRSPLDDRQVARLRELTGVDFASLENGGRRMSSQVSFDRPEMSLCLAKFADKESAEYKEALAIIRAGQEQAQRQPRADMSGFVACPKDLQREEKYVYRQEEETRNRQALREGKRAYDRQ